MHGDRVFAFGGQDRSEASLDQFYAWLGPRKATRIRLAIMDMWKELSRSLLNLAERDGKASYPQFMVRMEGEDRS